MAQVPRIQPFDVGGHYQNIGKAAGELVTKPVEGYFRGKEMGAKAQQAGLEAEKTQFELEDYARELEEAESSKEALDKVKDTTVRLVLGDEGYFALDPNKKEKMVEGDVMVESGGILKDDIPYREALLIVRDINSAKSAKEVKAIMGAVGRFVETQRGMREKYPGIKLDSFKADQVQPKTDKQGNVSVAYADDYPKRAQEIGVPAFLQTEAKTAIQDYIKKNPENPNEQEALQAVLGSKHGADISANQNLRNSIKDMFLSELDRYKAETGRIAAQQRAGREGRKEGLDVQKRNQDSKKITDSKIDKSYSALLKATGEDFRAKIKPIEWENLAAFQKATAGYSGKQLKVIQENGDEITKQSKVSALYAIATERGEALSEPVAEAIVIDMEDGVWDSPHTKKYAPLTGATEWGAKKEEGEGAGEKEPVQEPAAAPSPAPKPAAGEYTAEQESLISQYMSQYKGYSREQIIQAMKKEGRL